jgi:hypothetical protein
MTNLSECIASGNRSLEIDRPRVYISLIYIIICIRLINFSDLKFVSIYFYMKSKRCPIYFFLQQESNYAPQKRHNWLLVAKKNKSCAVCHMIDIPGVDPSSGSHYCICTQVCKLENIPKSTPLN